MCIARGNGYAAASIAGFDFIGITGSSPIMIERYSLPGFMRLHIGERERERGKGRETGPNVNSVVYCHGITQTYSLSVVHRRIYLYQNHPLNRPHPLRWPLDSAKLTPRIGVKYLFHTSDTKRKESRLTDRLDRCPILVYLCNELPV